MTLHRRSIPTAEPWCIPWWSNGCEIEGTVRNSVIGRGVVIKKGAVVEDSVILPA